MQLEWVWAQVGAAARFTQHFHEKNACYGAGVPVNATHPDYDANAFDWLRARDVLSGDDAADGLPTKWMPQLLKPLRGP